MMRGLQNCAIKEPEPFAQFSLCRTQWQKLSARFAGMEIKDRAAVQNIYSLTLLSGDDVGIDHVEAVSYGLKMSTMRKRNHDDSDKIFSCPNTRNEINISTERRTKASGRPPQKIRKPRQHISDAP